MIKFLALFLGGATLLFLFCHKEMPPVKKEGINYYVSLKDTLYLPFDTSKVLALYKLPLKDLSNNAPKDLDTLELADLMYACDCPGWSTKAELNNLDKFSTLNSEENKYHDVFYLEQGDPKVKFPGEWSIMRNWIRFYGKIRTRSGLSKDGYTDPHPPEGPVFTYYGYEVVLPAVIYGPDVYVKDNMSGKPEWATIDKTSLVVAKKNYFPPKTRSK